MKARVKGINDAFQEVTSVIIGDYASYDPEDLEFKIEDNLDKDSTTVNWEEVRIKASIAAMQGTITILSSSDRYAFREVVVEGFRGEQKTYPNEIAQFSVAVANALIKELKGE